MQNFHLIAQNVNIVNVMREIKMQPDLWNENDLRTKFPGTPHAEADDIWIWFNHTLLKGADAEYIVNDLEVVPYRAWKDLPSLRPLIFGLMAEVQAVRLGRVIITKLAPGKAIASHTDQGAPATYYKRYQIAINCLPGNIFKIGDEEISFKSGDIWWIDNTKEHSVINNSADDRIVCIVDLRLGL